MSEEQPPVVGRIRFFERCNCEQESAEVAIEKSICTLLKCIILRSNGFKVMMFFTSLLFNSK